MNPQNQPIIVNDTTFHHLLKAASDTKRAVAVKDARTGSVGFIVSQEQYQEFTQTQAQHDPTLFAFMDELHQVNADLDPEAVEEEIFRATMEVRHGTSTS